MLALLIDENLNHRILRGLKRAVPQLDFIVVQNVGLKGTPDPGVLAWTAETGRVLVTHDLKTVPKFAYERIRNGQPMPGVIAVPDTLPIGRVIDDLALLVECAQPEELTNLIIYLPL